MSTIRQKVLPLALVVGGLYAGAASAGIIDFTDSAQWPAAGGGNVSSGSPTVRGPFPLVGTVTLTNETVGGGDLIFGNKDATNTIGLPLAFDNDGVGIGDDELTQGAGQELGIKFEKATTVTGLHFLDLYTGNPDSTAGSGPTGSGRESVSVEFFANDDFTGSYGAATPFLSDLTQLNKPAYNGYLFASITQSGVQSIKVFMTPGWGSTDDGNNDAAVAGVSVVPIPAAAWLFGSALVGMVGLGRRKLAKA